MSEINLQMEFPVRCDNTSPNIIWTADNQRFCDMRGWGYLTGPGGLHLDDETAAAIQDARARYAVEAVNNHERLQRELSDVKAENERYKAMIGQAYRIEFTDHERVIEKYGVDSITNSSTGIVWIVQDESDQKLSRHETAIEAFESIARPEADSAA